MEHGYSFERDKHKNRRVGHKVVKGVFEVKWSKNFVPLLQLSAWCTCLENLKMFLYLTEVCFS